MFRKPADVSVANLPLWRGVNRISLFRSDLRLNCCSPFPALKELASTSKQCLCAGWFKWLTGLFLPAPAFAVSQKLLAKSSVLGGSRGLFSVPGLSVRKVTDHPNILRLLEIFEDVQPLRLFHENSGSGFCHPKDKNLFLVTELCGAGDLWRREQWHRSLDLSEKDGGAQKRKASPMYNFQGLNRACQMLISMKNGHKVCLKRTGGSSILHTSWHIRGSISAMYENRLLQH